MSVSAACCGLAGSPVRAFEFGRPAWSRQPAVMPTGLNAGSTDGAERSAREGAPQAMLELFKVRRGRKAAVGLISPLVERSRHRFDQIPEQAWFDPYMVGFLGMLITLVANRATGGLSSRALGLVQSDAWAEITHCRNTLIGEEMCLLSTAQNRFFQRGCASAERFLERLDGVDGAQSGIPVPSPGAPPAFPGYPGTGVDCDPAMAEALWAQHSAMQLQFSPRQAP